MNDQDSTLDFAGLGTRAYAYICDLIFRIILIVSIGLFSIQLSAASFSEGIVPIIESHQYLLFFWVLYHPVIECLWSGQTPGKKIAGIQVVTKRGQVPSIGATLLRNILRVIDMLPGTYLVGIIFCLGSKVQLRLGDILTNTMVVYTQKVKIDRESVDMPSATALDLEKKQYLEELIGRWGTMPIDRRCKLAQHFLQGLSMPTPLGFIDVQYDKTIRAMLLNLLKTDAQLPSL